MASRCLFAPSKRIATQARAGLLAQTAVRHSSGKSSSTSAIAYKANRRRQAPLPISDQPPSWSAQAAVSNILYETPTPSVAPPKRHVLNCLVQNEPGVLSRVSGILAARGFNIDSLVVCNTEVEDLSRMTIVLTGQDGVVEQARRQLEDLVPVWAVLDYTNSALVQRELLLAKINILGPEYFEELLAHHREITAPVEAAEAAPAASEPSLEEVSQDFHPSRLVVSEALRHKHEHLKNITYFAHQFGGKVLDISTNSCIVEISAKPERIDSFLKLIAPFGILESARTGLMALPRSPLYGPDEQDQHVKDADEVVDASTLPPG
ncbi:Putative mitochondrial acetolactate synthase small subunit precursor [Podospora comata]|uniref:Mitochondrial acetolactate synthase small subunit n=1 Tax=Podospora comata TaxID=48703 RepID=A0ABY6S6J1_PODCO|nr:Putative mitochondrial acetolactate synthase small subunit precursor [Podospora comata]